jgi:hypothetical protein
MDLGDPNRRRMVGREVTSPRVTRVAELRSRKTTNSPGVRVPKVQLEIYVFGFEITSLSNFETPDFGIPDSGFSIPQFPLFGAQPITV